MGQRFSDQSIAPSDCSRFSGGHRSPNPVRPSALSLFAVAFAAMLLFSQRAEAQAPMAGPPPVYSAVDEYGVDLINGTFIYSSTDVSIGQPGAGGLAFARTFANGGWRHNFIGTLNSSGTSYIVSIGMSSEAFTSSGSLPSITFTADAANGATLIYNSGTSTYTYTSRSGAVAVFDPTLASNGAMPWTANVARITTLTLPTGERTTFHYKTATAGGETARRLQSVTNNLGYQLHFEYNENSPTTAQELIYWGLLEEVTAINSAVDYCAPTADLCGGLTVNWPSVAYANVGTSQTITDELNQTTTLTFTLARLTGIRRPSSTSTNHILIGYSSTTGLVDTVGFGGGLADTINYSFADGGGERQMNRDGGSELYVRSSLTTRQILQTRQGASSNSITFYDYDANNRLTEITWPARNGVTGGLTEFVYDARGNVEQTTVTPRTGSGLSPIVTSAAYSASCANPVICNQPNSVTDARGFRTDYTYDSAHGGVLTVTSPAPAGSAPTGSGVRPQTRFTYQSLYAYYKGSSGSIIQAPSAVTRLTQVSACATTSSCSNGSDETRTTIAYGATGVENHLLPRTITAGAGNGSLTAVTATAYDAIGNVFTVDGPLPGVDDTTRYRFDAGRQLVGVVGPDPDAGSALKHRATRIDYNVDGQVIEIEQGTVNSQSDSSWAAFVSMLQQHTEYDFLGRAVEQSMAGGGATHSLVQMSYDDLLRPLCTATRMNPGAFTSLPADACALGTQGSFGPDRITQYAYNAAAQITQVTTGLGTGDEIDEQTITYGSSGMQDTLADAAGNLMTYEYDGFDRLYRNRYPNTSGGGSSTTNYEQFTYDSNSNVTIYRRRGGSTLTSTFDNLNRATLVDASSAGADVTNTYDNFNRTLTSAITGHTLTFGYDQLSRLTSQQSPLGTVSSQYDLAGRRTRLTWPGSPTFYADYDFNTVGDLTAIRENGATTGVGVLATYGYNDLGQSTTITRGNGANTTYSYFSTSRRLQSIAHNLTGGSGQDQTITLAYNPAEQIVSRVGSNTAYQWTPLTTGTVAYADNGLNQYTTVSGNAQTYDGRGNLTTGGLTYDIYSRLTDGPNSAALTYDPAGRLYQSQSASIAATRFLYDGVQIIGEYNGSNTLQRRYVPAGLDEPVVWYEGSGTTDRRWLAADQLGSIIAVMNASGAATTINTYDEYGLRGASNAGRFQFNGQPYLSEVGLYHYRARAYSPTLGRFMQTDPILWAGGMNLYGYVENDPGNWTDTLGLCGEEYIFTVKPDNSVVDTGAQSWTQHTRGCAGGGGIAWPGTGLGPGSGRTPSGPNANETEGTDWGEFGPAGDLPTLLQQFGCEFARRGDMTGREYGFLLGEYNGALWRSDVRSSRGPGDINMLPYALRAVGQFGNRFRLSGTVHSHPYPDTILSPGILAGDFGFSSGDINTAVQGFFPGATDYYAVYSDRALHITRAQAQAGSPGTVVETWKCSKQ